MSQCCCRRYLYSARLMPGPWTEITPTPFGWTGVRDERDGTSCPAADNSRERCSSWRNAPLLISQHRSCGAAAQPLCSCQITDLHVWTIRLSVCELRSVRLDSLSNFFLRSLYAFTPVPNLFVGFPPSDSICFLDLTYELLACAGDLIEDHRP